MFQKIDLNNLQVAPTIHWMESFGSWLYREGKMPKTIGAYLQDMRHFGRWYEGRTSQAFSPELLTRADVQSYFEWQAVEKAKAKSRNRRLASLRMMVRWAMEERLLEEDPTVYQKRAKESRLPRRAKDDSEVDALASVATVGAHLKRQTTLWAVLGQRDHVMWSLFIEGAFRIEEITLLDVDDLDFEQGIIRVIGKGGVDGEVKMADTLIPDLQAWLAVRPSGGTALLTDWHGQRLTPGQLRRRLKEIGKKAGVKVVPHDLRHTSIERVGRAAINSGLSQEKALDIMQFRGRHADKRTTLGYLRASYADISQAVNAAAVGVL